MKIYVASSWRNPWQPGVVALLREHGHEVYDFRNPEPGNDGFHWREIDPSWMTWPPEQYREALRHPIAEHGFKLDMDALRWCEACVLVQPCGTSSHLELGWAAGAGKRTAVMFPFGIPPSDGHSTMDGDVCPACGDEECVLPGRLIRVEPELMTKIADTILIGGTELLEWL
jgi:hypothetical protein